MPLMLGFVLLVLFDRMMVGGGEGDEIRAAT